MVRADVLARALRNTVTDDEVKVVNEIPKLGTGNVNYQELQALIDAAK